MHANNEIGNLLDIDKVSILCQESNAIFHCDTVQTIGHYRIDLKKTKIHFLACAAQRHVLQHRNIILDNRSHADDEPGRVIKENALADARGGMNIGLENLRRTALEIKREIGMRGAAQFFATPSPIPAVPQGPLKIAQHFSAGSAMGAEPSPDRDGRPLVPMTRSSLRDWRVKAPRTQHSSAGLFSVVPAGRPKPCLVVAKN